MIISFAQMCDIWYNQDNDEWTLIDGATEVGYCNGMCQYRVIARNNNNGKHYAFTISLPNADCDLAYHYNTTDSFEGIQLGE